MARRYALASMAAGATASAALVGANAAFCSDNSRSGASVPLSGECVNDKNGSRGGDSSRRGRLPSSSGFPPPSQANNVDGDAVARYRGVAIIATSAAMLSDGGDTEQKLRSTYADRFIRLIHLMNPRHTLTTESDVRRYQRLLQDHDAVKNNGSSDEDLLAATGKVDASCNVATGEVIPAPFRLSGFLLCNIPIVATMLFSKSVYVQVSRRNGAASSSLAA